MPDNDPITFRAKAEQDSQRIRDALNTTPAAVIVGLIVVGGILWAVASTFLR